jgi:hypothetical protein
MTYKSFSNTASTRDHVLNNQSIWMDIVYKAVLRDMKRFYIDDFNRKTQFIKCKKNNKYDIYAACIIEYI